MEEISGLQRLLMSVAITSCCKLRLCIFVVCDMLSSFGATKELKTKNVSDWLWGSTWGSRGRCRGAIVGFGAVGSRDIFTLLSFVRQSLVVAGAPPLQGSPITFLSSL